MYLTSTFSELVSVCDQENQGVWLLICTGHNFPPLGLDGMRRGAYSPKTKRAEWGMPLILFRYEKSPIICKRMCNIYKNWTLALPPNGSSNGRPASVFTNCPRLCPCVTGFVGWSLPALRVPMAAKHSVNGSVRIWYWCLGKVYPRVFSSLMRAIFPLHQNEVWFLIWGLGRKLCFFFFFLKHITLLSQEEDIHTQCGEATECPQAGLPWRGECSKSTQNLWRYIWMFTCDF